MGRYCSWEEVDKHIQQLYKNSPTKLTPTELDILNLLYENDGDYDIVSLIRKQEKKAFRQQAHRVFNTLKILLNTKINITSDNFKSELTLSVRALKSIEEPQTPLQEPKRPSADAKPIQQSSVIATLNLPQYWKEINKEYLEGILQKNQGELNHADTSTFYRCFSPDLIHALSPHKVPVRSFRSQASQDHNESREEMRKMLDDLLRNNQTNVITITGAIGEGKSTAFLQLICDFVNNPSHDFNLKVILKRSSDAAQTIQNMTEYIRQIQKDYKKQNQPSPKFLIAIDDASEMLSEIRKFIENIKKEDIMHIHFLLCSSEIDWIKAYQKQKEKFSNAHSCWETYHKCHHEPLTIKFSREDAKQLIKAWKQYDNNNDGQGWESIRNELVQKISLNKEKNTPNQPEIITDDDIVKYWFDENKKNTKTLDHQDFLGSMLRVRYGTRNRFKQRIISRLDDVFNQINNLNLRLYRRYKISPQKLYTYIAIAHANRIDFLRREIIMKLLNISSIEDFTGIMKYFGDEIHDIEDENKIKIFWLTRHQRIAEVFIEALKDNNVATEYDITEYLCELVESAMYAWRAYYPHDTKRRKKFDITSWNNVTDKFSENLDRAITIARTQFDIEEKHRVLFLTKLISFYRKKYEQDKNINDIDEAIRLLKTQGKKVERLRSFYNEWCLLAKEQAYIYSDSPMWISIHIYMYAISIADNTPYDAEERASSKSDEDKDLEERLKYPNLKKDAFQVLNKHQDNHKLDKANSAFQKIYSLFQHPKKQDEIVVEIPNLVQDLKKGFAQAYEICKSELPNDSDDWIFIPQKLSFKKIENIISQKCQNQRR